MSRLQLDNQIPRQYDSARLGDIVRAMCGQLNGLSEGLMSARYYNTTISPNATIAAAIGDIRWNGSVHASTIGALSYVNLGWVCTAEGSPGTWKEMWVPNAFTAVPVTGILPLESGGTNASLTASVNGVFVSTTTAASISTGFSYNGTTVASPGNFAIGANQVVTARQTGWTAPTGVLTRTAYSTYPGVTVGLTYDDLDDLFTTVQGLANHVKILSERLAAVETDLITHGLIGT